MDTQAGLDNSAGSHQGTNFLEECLGGFKQNPENSFWEVQKVHSHGQKQSKRPETSAFKPILEEWNRRSHQLGSYGQFDRWSRRGGPQGLVETEERIVLISLILI